MLYFGINLSFFVSGHTVHFVKRSKVPPYFSSSCACTRLAALRTLFTDTFCYIYIFDSCILRLDNCFYLFASEFSLRQLCGAGDIKTKGQFPLHTLDGKKASFDFVLVTSYLSFPR